MRLLARHGVREFWLVDPDAEAIEVYALAGDRFALTGIATLDPAEPGREGQVVVPDVPRERDVVQGGREDAEAQQVRRRTPRAGGPVVFAFRHIRGDGRNLGEGSQGTFGSRLRGRDDE